MLLNLISILKFYLQKFSFLHYLQHIFKSLYDSKYRQKFYDETRHINDWNRNYGTIISDTLQKDNKGSAVIFGWSSFNYVLSETLIRKSLEKAGYTNLVFATPNPITKLIYKIFGHDVKSFNKYMPLPNYFQAKEIVKSFNSSEELINYKFDDISVGKYACSSYMRHTRSGRIDLSDKKKVGIITKYLAISIASAIAANRMIKTVNPALVVVIDRGYSPFGEVFDACINNSIDIISWNIAHRDNSIMLKRYNKGNRMSHPSSLSSKSWEILKNIDKNFFSSNEVINELDYCYSSGQWYSEVGTQFNKFKKSKNDLISNLGLSKDKKTAVIFAHIFWDATFFWGEDLFIDYEDWFIQTVKAACMNPNLNWIIKVHPANLVKNFRDNIHDEPSEVTSLRDNIGELPKHVKLISADSDISTWSLFDVMDFCITVRGTVGIESALLGKKVLTAGTGRYDRHGFTNDFDSKNEYLNALANIHKLEELTNEERELASRYASGIFVKRPVFVTSFDIRHQKDNFATLTSNVLVKDSTDLELAEDINSISNWLNSKDEDYFNVE